MGCAGPTALRLHPGTSKRMQLRRRSSTVPADTFLLPAVQVSPTSDNATTRMNGHLSPPRCRSMWLSMTLMLTWISILFIIMMTVSEKFFCPSLEILSDAMRLPANVAGVTLLSFGNGANDVFTQYAAAGQVRPLLHIMAPCAWLVLSSEVPPMMMCHFSSGRGHIRQIRAAQCLLHISAGGSEAAAAAAAVAAQQQRSSSSSSSGLRGSMYMPLMRPSCTLNAPPTIPRIISACRAAL
jgi:hypothetical protein